MTIINSFTLTARGSTLGEQILTSQVDSRAVRMHEFMANVLQNLLYITVFSWQIACRIQAHIKLHYLV